jgi:hypothetical protein
MTGEKAVDFFLWLDGTLFAIQSRNLADAHGVDALLDDITLATQFRGVLWRSEQESGALPIAERLGLPLISESSVIFVLLARSGLAAPKSSAASGRRGGAGGSGGSSRAAHADDDLLKRLRRRGWAGGLIVPGNRGDLNRLDSECSTWLDLMLGPTFSPLVHLLGL